MSQPKELSTGQAVANTLTSAILCFAGVLSVGIICGLIFKVFVWGFEVFN